MSGTWISPATIRNDARVRLFCIAHAGGGGSFFRPWREPLLPDIEVCPVVLPGREGRLRETAHNKMAQLISPLFDALSEHVDKPYALFGHSMGAVIAYEVARRFCASLFGSPLCLFVSGRRAPHLLSKRPSIYNLPETEFLARVSGLNGTPPELLQEEEFIKHFLPCLRADLELNETYSHSPGAPLSCRVSAFVGDQDPEVDPYEISAWQHVTSSGFKWRIFSGDHFYLKGARLDVLAAIREDIRQAISLLAGN